MWLWLPVKYEDFINTLIYGIIRKLKAVIALSLVVKTAAPFYHNCNAYIALVFEPSFV